MTRRELIRQSLPRLTMLLMPLPGAALVDKQAKRPDWHQLAMAVKDGTLTINQARECFGLAPVSLDPDLWTTSICRDGKAAQVLPPA